MELTAPRNLRKPETPSAVQYKAERKRDANISDCSARVVIVVVETTDFRERVLLCLREKGYRPIEVEPHQLFEMTPTFDINREAHFFLEAGVDSKWMRHLLEQIYHHWSDECGGIVYAFWPPMPEGNCTFWLFHLEGTTWRTSAYYFNTGCFNFSQRDNETIERLIRMYTDLR